MVLMLESSCPVLPINRSYMIWETTYYKQLIQGGVKIYEYEPGFVHSKVFICDDTYATVGTIT